MHEHELRLAPNIEALNNELARFDMEGATIALVPTMGNLHEGHISLVKLGLELADAVIATIFVNPMQFGPNEDLDAYPRTLADDIEKLSAAGCSVLFHPSTDEIYPEGIPAHTQVSVPGLTDALCGASRPGHFDGVTTIVAKLFNLVGPDIAIFGEKDLQQLLVIKKMTDDMGFPIEIVGAPIARAEDGLALSSRNGYLSPEERAIAPELQRQLQNIERSILAGRHDFEAMAENAKDHLAETGFEPDYIEIRNRDDLKLASEGDKRIAIFAAAKLGKTRLIDNIQIDLQ